MHAEKNTKKPISGFRLKKLHYIRLHLFHKTIKIMNPALQRTFLRSCASGKHVTKYCLICIISERKKENH